MRQAATIYFLNMVSALLICNTGLLATNFYADPSSLSPLADGSMSHPWKTVAQVNQGTRNMQPGDTVFFKNGESFSGRLFVWGSGNAEKPVVYTSYGTGPKPEFTHTASDVIMIQNRQYVVIEGFKIIDRSMDSSAHDISARISYGIVIDNSPRCRISNCEITRVGIGIAVIKGSNNTVISENHIHNLRMVRNTIGGDDDFGANALVIGSRGNLITQNRFENCWANSHDYGYDGGAVEFFGENVSENSIMFNASINNNGFLEAGSNNGGIVQNNTVAYNKIINNGYSGVFHTSAAYSVKISNMNYFNNVIVETKKQFAYPKKLFWISDPSSAGAINFQNNIVWLKTGIHFATKTNDTSVLHHTNNIYLISGGGLLGVTTNPTEILASALPLFADTTGDPAAWNFELLPGAVAIDMGADVGLSRDYAGKSISGKPDLGIFEWGTTVAESDPVKININVERKSLVHVYPNPSSYVFFITTPDLKNTPAEIKIKLVNQGGSVLLTDLVKNNIPYVFGNELQSGWYTLIAEVGTMIQTIQLIKL